MDNIKYLSNLELEIYHYVIAHKDTITKMKMKELSAILHVSPAMISRVAKKLGYAGFTEWKIALKIDNNEYVKPNESNLNYIMDFFQHVNDGEFDKNVREAGKMVAKADTVLFYGLCISMVLPRPGLCFLIAMARMQFMLKIFQVVLMSFIKMMSLLC